MKRLVMLIVLLCSAAFGQGPGGTAVAIINRPSLPSGCAEGNVMNLIGTGPYWCDHAGSWVSWSGGSGGGITWPGGATAGQVPQAVDTAGDLGASGMTIQPSKLGNFVVFDSDGLATVQQSGIGEGQAAWAGTTWGNGDYVNNGTLGTNFELGGGTFTGEVSGNPLVPSGIIPNDDSSIGAACVGDGVFANCAFKILPGGGIANGGGTPTFIVGAAAGTGATCTGSGTDLSGQVVIVIGTSQSSGVLCTVTFNSASYPNAVFPVLQLAAQPPCVGCTATEAGVLQTSVVYTYPQPVGSPAYTGFAIYTNGTARTTYIWNYSVTGH